MHRVTIHCRRLLTVTGILFFLAGSLLLRDSAAAAPKVYTPPPGSAERRSVLDVMRLRVKELHELDVVFVVKEMKVCGGWAWVHTLPRSKEGIGRYEDFYALLHKKHGRWTIAEIPCTEPDNSECMDSPGYFRRLAGRYPGLPSGVLPEDAVRP